MTLHNLDFNRALTNEESLQKVWAKIRDWKDDPRIPLPRSDSFALDEQIRDSCMDLLREEYGITTIKKSDYDRIGENAYFLVYSSQVNHESDIDLDATYECFCDTQINEEMIEIENNPKKCEESVVLHTHHQDIGRGR